jgi:DNA-binding IclR family transcriptional regulator
MQSGTPINLARRELISLCMDLGSECNFLVLSDLETVIVERCDLIDGVPVNRPVQVAPRAWHETGTGKAIVAFYAPDARQNVMERTYKRPSVTLPPRESLEAELETARTTGYVLSLDRRNANQMGAVLPVFDRTGYAVAAIGSYMKRDDAKSEGGMAFIARMAVAAGRISHYLGYEEEG